MVENDKQHEHDTLVENLPVLNFLYNFNGFPRSILMRVVGLFLGIYILGLMLTSLDGSVNLGSKGLGYVQDVANSFFHISFIMSFYLIYRLGLKFSHLFDSELKPALEVGAMHDVDIEASLRKWKGRINGTDPHAHRLIRILHFTMGVCYCAFAIYLPIATHQVEGNTWNFSFNPWTWTGPHPFGYFFNQAKDTFVFVILLPAALWQTALIALATRQMVKEIAKHDRLKIIPVFPDRAGGLSPLGQISLLLFYIVIVQLLHLLPTSIIYGMNWGYRIIYPLFFAFAVLVFFYPMKAARRPMKEAKRRELERIAVLIRQVYDALKQPTDAISTEQATKVEQIVALKELYRQTEGMPVWPYNFGTLAKFSTVFLIPVIVYLIQVLATKDFIVGLCAQIWCMIRTMVNAPC
jgi:hypothetical protein